jgi:hypothetical protein
MAGSDLATSPAVPDQLAWVFGKSLHPWNHQFDEITMEDVGSVTRRGDPS